MPEKKKKRAAPLWVVAILAVIAAVSVTVSYRDGEINCEASVDTEDLIAGLAEDMDDDSADDDSAGEE
jgi:hypothetical protein